ncbi:hypothetical protein ACN26Y_04650 [Micromonospora sp. WMMD558]|uniref:hypothetical protein n=1 Tax=unclassified Micromonospora TaxID=2617518 RepID=UPI0012B47FB2|nr:hypothetical protein [Micromonospora sp. WMMC415]QGN45620.1 hypothetical protein GKC29_01250 [Micromonospora sp. WMMC415]
MSLWEIIWRIGQPLLVVCCAATAVSIAVSDPPDKFSRPRGWQWAWLGVWLLMAGEAAFGDDRPWFERAWKGTAALLVAVAAAVAAWRHYRWRRNSRLAGGSPRPITRPPRSDS